MNGCSRAKSRSLIPHFSKSQLEKKHVLQGSRGEINADTYGDGWLIELATQDTDRLLDPAAYAQHLIEAWQVAQRTIKGQANH